MLNHRDETPMEYAQDTCASPTVYGNATDLTESGPLPTGAGGTMAGKLDYVRVLLVQGSISTLLKVPVKFYVVFDAMKWAP